ncbi:MAG: LLM class F420-dependent oxidoreductase [Myxococcales bacterium]|nr:LLM class F420-dependent oxidoreductase [Myxococcales bacterium]
MPIRMALQIPNFTYPGTATSEIFDRVATSAQTAEAAGFDAVLVMDHFYQLPMLGPPHNEMLEAYPLLGAIAARTERVRLGTLVTGNTYRNPAHLAKLVTTLDVVSKGRAIFGIGAGWFEPEHAGYGFDFPPIGERLGRLDEALQIARAMFRSEQPTFKGRYYTTENALNVPPPVQAGGPAVLVGGTGEKRTLRLVAQYADESNWTCDPSEFPRKMEALEGHCAAVGRDRSEIGVSWLGTLVVGETTAAAESARNAFLAERGMDWATLPAAAQDAISQRLVLGDPDTVGEFVQTKIRGQGLDGIVVNLPANGHRPEAVELAARVLAAAL